MSVINRPIRSNDWRILSIVAPNVGRWWFTRHCLPSSCWPDMDSSWFIAWLMIFPPCRNRLPARTTATQNRTTATTTGRPEGLDAPDIAGMTTEIVSMSSQMNSLTPMSQNIQSMTHNIGNMNRSVYGLSRDMHGMNRTVSSGPFGMMNDMMPFTSDTNVPPPLPPANVWPSYDPNASAYQPYAPQQPVMPGKQNFSADSHKNDSKRTVVSPEPPPVPYR